MLMYKKSSWLELRYGSFSTRRSLVLNTGLRHNNRRMNFDEQTKTDKEAAQNHNHEHLCCPPDSLEMPRLSLLVELPSSVFVP